MQASIDGEHTLTELDYARLKKLNAGRLSDMAHWQAPHGEPCTAEVTARLFQPEASGDSRS